MPAAVKDSTKLAARHLGGIKNGKALHDRKDDRLSSLCDYTGSQQGLVSVAIFNLVRQVQNEIRTDHYARVDALGFVGQAVKTEGGLPYNARSCCGVS